MTIGDGIAIAAGPLSLAIIVCAFFWVSLKRAKFSCQHHWTRTALIPVYDNPSKQGLPIRHDAYLQCAKCGLVKMVKL